MTELSWRAKTLIAKNLHVTRGDTLLCSQVTFNLTSGQILHVQGPNGVGKTTLLMILAGLISEPMDRREEHALVWADLPVLDWPILYIGHLSGLNSQLSVRQNLEFLLGLDQKPTTRLSAALDCVGLSGYEDVVVSRLSSGQQRRVSLARLWLSDDSDALWLLDEPFNALDASMTKTLIERLVVHIERGGRIILTSHQALMIPAQTLDLDQYFSEQMDDQLDAEHVDAGRKYGENRSE